MGTPAYDKANTTRVNLKLNNKTDEDIIRQLRKVDSIQGYIKRLIRDDMTKKEEKTMENEPKRISVDNGAHYVQPVEAIAAKPWDLIVSYMDDEVRETVHAELAPCSELEFLTRYLELANEDLIIG